ncbi:histidine kinase [Streptomyces albus]|uniref:histidine kinase n=1 Tax=Streptomyces albus TaxID=1888 RepID=UPI0033DE25CE
MKHRPTPRTTTHALTVLAALSALLSVFAGPWWIVPTVVCSFLSGHRPGTARTPALVLAATLAANMAAALATPAWLTPGTRFVAVALTAGLLSWFAGRFLRQYRELARAGWERAEQLERERRLVAEQARLRERSRIAQDMHDALGHELSLLALSAGALKLAPGLAPEHREVAEGIRGRAEAAVDRLGEVIGVLRETAGAAPTRPADTSITRLVEEAAASGLAVTAHVAEPPAGPGATDPPPAVLHAAHRIVQEALTNVAKHAPGATATVRVTHATPDAGETGPPATHVVVQNGPAPAHLSDDTVGETRAAKTADSTEAAEAAHAAETVDASETADAATRAGSDSVTGTDSQGGVYGQGPHSEAGIGIGGRAHSAPDASETGTTDSTRTTGVTSHAADSVRAPSTTARAARTDGDTHTPGAASSSGAAAFSRADTSSGAAASSGPGENGGSAAGERPGGGHGLIGLDERVRLAGGSFRCGPTADGGFRVCATLPHVRPARPSGPPGAGPVTPSPASPRQRKARREMRRTVLTAVTACLALGALLGGVLTWWDMLVTRRAVLPAEDFGRLRVGQERDRVAPLLPDEQTRRRPAHTPPPPQGPGTTCEFYAMTANPFDDRSGDAYRLCFRNGKLVAAQELRP